MSVNDISHEDGLMFRHNAKFIGLLYRVYTGLLSLYSHVKERRQPFVTPFEDLVKLWITN